MKEILTDKMLRDIFKALEKGEPFEYQDANTQISITPMGISLQYHSDDSDKEIRDFLNYCDSLDDDLFIEVCESFKEEELSKLQNQLDTDNYKKTITTFTERVREIANNKLAEIENSAKAEIELQEKVINDARSIIIDINKTLSEAYAKYSV